MVEFDMLGMASCSCAIVTLSLRHTVFSHSLQKCRNFENQGSVEVIGNVTIR